MVTLKQMREHFSSLYTGNAVYVWGMNCEEITPESIDKAYKRCHSKAYDKAYFDAKLKEGLGRVGADCSGSFYPMSGYDTTAQGYYNRCLEKGKIKNIDKEIPCMVFIEQNDRIVHIGWYDGKGYVYEMKNSKANVRHDKLSARSWTYYGIPEFVDYTPEEEDKVMIEMSVLRKGSKGAEVKTAQRLLKALGYSIGLSGVDGDYGAKTETAVKKFQAKKGLKQDGIIGKDTWTALLK